jgi:transcriptional regulator of acetoin/glycerol metabolism
MREENNMRNTSAKRIKALWELHVAGDEPFPNEAPEGIRQDIFDSWRRSKAAGVSPFDVNNVLLGEQELETTKAHNQKLIALSHSYIEKLNSFVKGSNFVIALTDRFGVVLDLIGLEGMIEERARRSALQIGCSRSETLAGTCGIGTCLALGEPIQIWGAEHFIQPHHDYVCSAAPIHDDVGGIIACIDAIGPSEEVTKHTLGMVCAAADGIEKEFKMLKAYDQISIANGKLFMTLQSLSQGIIMLDNNGIVTQSNDSSKSVLKLLDREITGANICDLLDFQTTTFDVFSLTKNVSHREMNVTNAIGIRLNLSVSASVLEDDAGEKISTVLILEERKQFNKVATKVSGFTAKYNFNQIIGVAEEIREIKQLGMLAAQSDSNVLILGESGTGKDLLAQSIHNASARAKAPFIAINCGSLPRSLVESELFGYEPGAFTGASRDGAPGKFELADGGSLFLDEIGDMPIEIQATLLRAIQTKEILRIGGKMPKRIDVRVIAATNVNLAELIENKQFRKDLYYRLNVLTFRMPSLRERKEDIPILIDKFIETYNARMGMNVQGLTPAAMDHVVSYDWPGNIRELENMVERAMNLVTGSFVTERDLGQEILRSSLLETDFVYASRGGGRDSAPWAALQNRPRVYGGFPAAFPLNEEKLIREALSQVRGNVTKASRLANIPKRTMYRRIEQFGIDLEEFRA